MLTGRGGGSQDAVIQKITAFDQAQYADPRIQQYPHPGHVVDDALGQHLLGGLQPEDQCVQDDAGSEYHAGLEAAAGPVVPVKLDIQCEQQDHRDDGLGHDS